MNVVQREKLANMKNRKPRNEFVRKDANMGNCLSVRGGSVLPILSYNTSKAARPHNAPRYQFVDKGEPSTAKKNSMGPPLELPRGSAKRRLHQPSASSTKPESSSSGKHCPRVLASDSMDTSDFCTPSNRPTALRYISSSSRGGHSGTRSARSTSNSVVEPSVILAISEGRGMARGEIGIAAVDLRHPHLVLCQFSDTLLYTHTLTKINYFNPIEIIVPHTFCEGVQPNQLYQLIKDHYPLVNLTTVQRRHFNDAAGRQQIQTLCAPQYSAVYLQVLQKFYALTAAAAVLKYVEYIQCIVFAKESLKIEYHSSENTMVIDVGTATQLELVHPLVPSAGPTCCLLGVLGPTYTIGGIRALRAAILQPSCKREFIEARLDAVQEIIENVNGLMTGLQNVLKKLADIDRILLLCMETQNQNMDKVGEAQLNQTLLLKTTMDVVPSLIEALQSADSCRLRRIKMDFENPHYKEIADRIYNVIQEDAHLEKGAMGSLQRCFAVKPDINGLLDVARRTYSELIEDIQKIVEQLSESYDLPIRLNQNMMKGFHIVMPVAPKQRRNFNVDDLPPIFIQVNFNGASVSMTTEELVVLDQQAKESLNEIQKMSNIVISGLLKDLRPFMSSLYKLCEDVAELDILLALAQASSVGSYIRPDFNTYMDVKNSVHPLLDYNSQVLPIPNDIFASPEYNFTIITGPNMGGKSIYIKQVALMQIMAQLGCFLPATNAVLRLCDRIFSRIGFNDSVELNASTYVFEMKEMQHIMSGLTSTSLVIIDELCRGTCTEEGTSMAWAICEELLMSDAFTFFTTHFMYLTRLQDLYFNVVNRHTSVTEEEITTTQNASNPQKRLVYQHKIEPGTSKIEHYGLALASKTNLPEGTVKLAMELAELITQTRKPQEVTTPQSNEEAILYKLNAEVRLETRKNPNSDEKVKQIIRKFKEDHPQMIERLKVQKSRSHVRTDSSANYTDSNSKQESSNEMIQYKGSNIVERNQQRESIEEHNNPIFKPPKLPVVLCNASDDADNSENLGNDYIAQSPNETNKSLQTKKQSQRPVVIYSTSDDAAEAQTIDSSKASKYTSVKSSNELLTSVMNIDNEESCEDTAASYENSENENLPSVDVDNRNVSITKTTVNDYNNNLSKLNKDMADDNLSNSNIGDTDTADELEDTEILVSTSSESDIAEALTQVIETVDEETMSVDPSSDEMSIDEELMTETIEEINQELAYGHTSIENIILTPPLSFRD